jgi:hypothetical protein
VKLSNYKVHLVDGNGEVEKMADFTDEELLMMKRMEPDDFYYFYYPNKQKLVINALL